MPSQARDKDKKEQHRDAQDRNEQLNYSQQNIEKILSMLVSVELKVKSIENEIQSLDKKIESIASDVHSQGVRINSQEFFLII